MEPEKICENCVYCTCENYCIHREGPYRTWPENHCSNFESKEKDNETMKEELEKKYGVMSIDDMIEKMESQEKKIKELEANYASHKNINAIITRDAAELEVDNYNLRKEIAELMQQLADKTVIIKDLDTHNDELLKDFGEATKEVEKKRTRIIELENGIREKEAKIASLTQELADKKNQIWRLNEDIAKYCEDTNPKIGTLTARLTFKENQVRDLEKKLAEKDMKLADKDDVIEDLEERLEHQKHIILNYERDIVRYSKSDEEKKYLENDISSLYPNKFDLDPNADCPAYAARMKAKYDSLIKVGFTEDQAMAMIPMWMDE